MSGMRRPGQQSIKGHPKTKRGIDPMDWLNEELNWSGFVGALAGLCEEDRGNLRDFDGAPPFSQPPL
jgi:hypothetical protein